MDSNFKDYFDFWKSYIDLNADDLQEMFYLVIKKVENEEAIGMITDSILELQKIKETSKESYRSKNYEDNAKYGMVVLKRLLAEYKEYNLVKKILWYFLEEKINKYYEDTHPIKMLSRDQVSLKASKNLENAPKPVTALKKLEGNDLENLGEIFLTFVKIKGLKITFDTVFPKGVSIDWLILNFLLVGEFLNFVEKDPLTALQYGKYAQYRSQLKAKQVVILRIYYDMYFKQIASVLKIKESTVRTGYWCQWWMKEKREEIEEFLAKKTSLYNLNLNALEEFLMYIFRNKT